MRKGHSQTQGRCVLVFKHTHLVAQLLEQQEGSEGSQLGCCWAVVSLCGFSQVVALHDCLYRLRYTSEWVAYADLDDYLWTPQLPQNLKKSTPTASDTTNSNSRGSSAGAAVSQSLRQMMAPCSGRRRG